MEDDPRAENDWMNQGANHPAPSSTLHPSSLSIRMIRPHLENVPEPRPLPAGYELRAATEADEPGLATLLGCAFPEFAWPVEKVRTELTRHPDVLATYLVTHDGVPVATASVLIEPDRHPGTGIVHWVGTDPDHLRRGLAQQLLARLLDDFRERGFTSAHLITQDERLPAIRSYLRFGFIPDYTLDDQNQPARWSAILQAIHS